MHHSRGVTLLELMIVVTIVAITTAFALPAYQAYVQRADRATLQADLLQAVNTLERYKTQNFTYNNIPSSQLPSRSPSSGAIKYNIAAPTITGSGTAFSITATSTSSFDRTRTEVLKINNLGQRCISSLVASGADCTLGSGTTW